MRGLNLQTKCLNSFRHGRAVTPPSVREANQGSSFGGAVSRVYPRLTEGVCLHSKTAVRGLLICKKITKNKNRRDLSGKKT